MLMCFFDAFFMGQVILKMCTTFGWIALLCCLIINNIVYMYFVGRQMFILLEQLKSFASFQVPMNILQNL